ncbi:hypothetical protein EVAR_41434_1 [Eumeta japonica]|uniref:Uncharacterized protein n=1 Tax=Eumeta variegata TaxID=151549 RepID=A0A4C1W4U3_EUMVA|nr:hypothetical protein EVAR_41434_1 [Eumeta japonica]
MPESHDPVLARRVSHIRSQKHELSSRTECDERSGTNARDGDRPAGDGDTRGRSGPCTLWKPASRPAPPAPTTPEQTSLLLSEHVPGLSVEWTCLAPLSSFPSLSPFSPFPLYRRTPRPASAGRNKAAVAFQPPVRTSILWKFV